MEIAKVRVNGVCAKTIERRVIPMGIIGATVSFEYTDPRWDNLTKTVVFRGAVTRDILNAGETVTIPAETVSRPSVLLRVGVYGTDSSGTVAIPTLWADLGIARDAADPSGDPAADPELPIWAQLQAEIEALKKLAGIGFGSEDAGKLLYIGEDGSVQPLALGKSLEIVDGVLTVTGVTGGGETVTAEITANVVDGLLVLTDSSGAAITAELSDDGLLSWPGVVMLVDDAGNVTFKEE